MPTTTQQFTNLQSKLPKITDFYDIESEKMEAKNKKPKEKKPGQKSDTKKEYKVSYKLKQNLTENHWKEACLTRWVWIKEELDINPKLTPTYFAEKNGQIICETQTRLSNKVCDDIRRYQLQKSSTYDIPKYNYPDHNWQQLFLKLDLEDHLLYFDMLIEFKLFY